MYSRNDDRVCHLGLPIHKKKTSKNSVELQNAKQSFLGGQPIWHSIEGTPSSLEDLICQVCGDSQKIVQVAQVYAPTEEIDRSLYIFCCNKRSCSLKQEGWKVIRNQTATATAAVGSQEYSKYENITTTTTTTTPPTTTTTTTTTNNNNNPSSSSSSSSSSVWSFLSEESTSNAQQSEEDELMLLLNARNNNLAAAATARHQQVETKKNNSTPSKNKAVKDRKTSVLTRKMASVIPQVMIEEVPEEWNELAHPSVSNEHIARLVRSYLEEEDDEENMQALQAAGIKKSDDLVLSSNNGNGDHETSLREDEEVEEGIKRIEEDGEEEEDDDDEDREIAGNEVERYFQERVSAEPKQVLRYAYEGRPLWISSPSPLNCELPQSIPPCEGCGSARVFECQLMPALLSYLTPPSSSSSESKSETPSSQGLHAMLGDGLDFGVVTVWVCPQSCPWSRDRGMVLEAVVVQPPPDINS
eukprot:scaffold3290_cov165-Ochromonas_danica.AAC.67